MPPDHACNVNSVAGRSRHEAVNRLGAMLEELGAREAWLYTMSFQAKPFYEKLRYTQFAELPWLNGQHARHCMRKDL